MNKQEMQLKMANGNVLNFRFDMGTARVIKEITGKDPMKETWGEDWWEYSVAIFTASYIRACKIYKVPPAYTVDELRDLYDELDMKSAIEFIKAFNGTMSVQATPETVNAIKEAEIIQQEQNSMIGESAKIVTAQSPSEATVPNP
jgi:hypothetical protein